ncbi:hypothetical protein HY214_00785 [Candidatus Roizmanbacteria bacterium]|nr:hypothetical protein [Candidatus Roizmanbacteria bacterium]
MDNLLKTILNKLDAIDGRLKEIEKGEPAKSITVTQSKNPTVRDVKKDPYLEKTLGLLAKYEVMTCAFLQKEFGIDANHADKLLDQLEAAGYGKCYWEDITA